MKPIRRKKTAKILICLADEDRKMIRDFADKHHLSLSKYTVNLLLQSIEHYQADGTAKE